MSDSILFCWATVSVLILYRLLRVVDRVDAEHLSSTGIPGLGLLARTLVPGNDGSEKEYWDPTIRSITPYTWLTLPLHLSPNPGCLRREARAAGDLAVQTIGIP